MDIHLKTAHNHCVFMNSFHRPPKSEHLKCFEKNSGILYGNEFQGYRYNIKMLSSITYPTIPPNSMSETEKFKIFNKCHKKYSTLLTDEDIDEFWKCVEPNVGGFHPSLFNWDMVFPANKQQLTAKCRNETGLTGAHYDELCSKRTINDITLSYLLCIGRNAELNNGQCYFADRGIVTLMTKYDEEIVKDTVKRCIYLVLDEDVFNFQIYYHCIFNSNLFGKQCFV